MVKAGDDVKPEVTYRGDLEGHHQQDKTNKTHQGREDCQWLNETKEQCRRKGNFEG